MKKVLFICELFSPANHVSAIRPTKLAKYLSREPNLQITVVAQKTSFDMLVDNSLVSDIKKCKDKIRVFYVEDGLLNELFKNFIKSREEQKKKNDGAVGRSANNSNRAAFKRKSNLQNVKETILYAIKRILIWEKAFITYRYIQKRQLEPDVVITMGPNYSDLVGHFIRKKQKTYWIADFRDPFLSDYTPKLFRNSATNYGKRIVSNSDCVVAVTPGYLNSLFLNERQYKKVLSNGFDGDDIASIECLYKKPGKFQLVCVGALYRGKRKLDPLYAAINELYKAGRMQLSDIEILYAGNGGQEIVNTAVQYGLEENTQVLGQLPREKSLSLQKGADILLLPSWNTFSGQDIMPGKFLEYLMMEKPIISIIGGEAPDSYIKQLTGEMNLGFVYEEKTHDKDFKELKEYLLYQYSFWKRKGVVEFKPNKQMIENYNYKTVAKKYLQFIEGEQKND